MEIQSKLSQSSEAASWILWMQLPLLATNYDNFESQDYPRKSYSFNKICSSCSCSSSPLHSYIINGKVNISVPSPVTHNTASKKIVCERTSFDVYVLGCLGNTWAHFPLYVTVLRGCWRSHSLSIQDLSAAEKIPNNKTFPTHSKKNPQPTTKQPPKTPKLNTNQNP